MTLTHAIGVRGRSAVPRRHPRGARFVPRAVLALLALAAAPAAPGALDAQTAVPIQHGSRIRIASAPYTGSAVAAWASDDSLTLVIDGRVEPLRVPVTSISSITVRRDTPRSKSVRRGALWGFAIGTLVYVASFTWADYNAQYPTDPKYTRLTPVGAALLYMGGGTAAGALVGAVVPGHQWETTRGPVRVWVTR